MGLFVKNISRAAMIMLNQSDNIYRKAKTFYESRND